MYAQRIDEHQLVKKLRIVGTCHDRNRRGLSGCDDACAVTDLRFDEIRDQLDVEVIRIRHVCFLRASTSEQIDRVDRVIVLERGDNPTPLVTARGGIQIVDQKQGHSASGFRVMHISETPFEAQRF